jgi:hypothetical protein
MAALDGEDAAAQQETLRQLCPCRNRVYDREAWLAILHAWESAESGAARHQAGHALETLVARAGAAVPDPEAQDLLHWLQGKGFTLKPEPEQPPRRGEKVDWRRVPEMLAALHGDDPDARHRALRLLCPCRNRRYDREVWLAILRIYEESGVGTERDDAGHAIGTLLERARTDPRSQELLRWLAGQGVTSLPLEAAVPVWQPRSLPGRGGLRIPPIERAPRSRANRRR